MTYKMQEFDELANMNFRGSEDISPTKPRRICRFRRNCNNLSFTLIEDKSGTIVQFNFSTRGIESLLYHTPEFISNEVLALVNTKKPMQELLVGLGMVELEDKNPMFHEERLLERDATV